MSTTLARSQPTRPARSGIPRAFAALIGLLAVGAAVGGGHLVAALVSPASSPFLAVGDTVIRYSPQVLTEFAKTTFGTADKPVLLSGMAVVILAIAAVGGIVSRHRPTPGVTLVTVLGVLGFLAVMFSPTFAPLDLLAPAASLVAGVGAFRLLHAQALRTYDVPAGGGPAPEVVQQSHIPALSGQQSGFPEPEGTGPDNETAPGDGRVSRRGVLIGSTAAVGVGALAAGTGGLLLGGGVGDSRQSVTARLASARLTETAPPIPPGADFADVGTPSFITPNPAFYRVDTALRVPGQAASDWRLRVHGMVDRELTLTFDDLLARPLVERTITLTCVSNEVGGPYISTANFVGVDLRDILLEAGVQPGADQVLSTSLDRWTAGTPTDVLLEPDRGALLAIGMNGEALPPEHGFPVRMVVPGLYGFVSATKWLADLEVTTFDAVQGYWRHRGWGKKAPIKTQSRIDSPKPFASVPAGRVAVAGIAWSQPTGISKVEVRVDGGGWQEATLATEVNYDTWRMWRTEFDLASGSHTVQTRATDRNGVTQTQARANPIPDGASGWPAQIFSVT